MRSIWGLLLTVALSRAAAAGESPDGFYLGTLTGGTRDLDVALELKSEASALSGSYYYFTLTPRPLTLRGTVGPQGAVRLEESPEDGKVTGLWTGTLANGELRGTWKDAKKARTWSFQLVRSERATRYFDGAPRSAEAGSAGTLSYVMARVPNSEHRVPVITSFRDPKVIAAVNATLMGAAAAAHCEQEPDDYSFKSEVGLAAEDVLSVRIRESWFCQAAYPDAGDRSITFDLRTGQPIQRDDLFRKDATPEQIAEVLYPYELSESGKPRGTPKEAGQQSREEECADAWTLQSLARAGFTYFHLTAEGLVVSPEFPHVIAYCASEVTVPYAALAPIVARGGSLSRLVAAQAGKPLRYRIHAPVTLPEKDVFFTPPPR